MDYQLQRSQMVEYQLKRRGINDPAVLAAMESVPREAFVPEQLKSLAYDDSPLPIGQGQTISQPFIVALMITHLALEPQDRVLEIGTGSGYNAAVMGRIAARVDTIERHADLTQAARKNLAALGFDNIYVHVGDGSLGWPDAAPYDAIVGTCGAPEIPPSWKSQLAVGGRMVLPLGSTRQQQVLMGIQRESRDHFAETPIEAVRFVPLVGEQGWPR